MNTGQLVSKKFQNYRCKGADVVVAGAFGGKIGFWGLFLRKSDFLNCKKACYNCYILILNSIKVKIVKGYKLLQPAENLPILLQVVTILLQVVTKVCYKVVTAVKYCCSVIYKRCNKCYKCNS